MLAQPGFFEFIVSRSNELTKLGAFLTCSFFSFFLTSILFRQRMEIWYYSIDGKASRDYTTTIRNRKADRTPSLHKTWRFLCRCRSGNGNCYARYVIIIPMKETCKETNWLLIIFLVLLLVVIDYVSFIYSVVYIILEVGIAFIEYNLIQRFHFLQTRDHQRGWNKMCKRKQPCLFSCHAMHVEMIHGRLRWSMKPKPFEQM
jgi:hypothetical protein